MFHPVGQPMERGWVGRIDGDRVTHLAAQTLQSLFTGGGSAREHAEYRLASVRLLAPVLHPPTIRVFDAQDSFAFANASAVVGPRAEIAARVRGTAPSNSLLQGGLALLSRIAAVIGADGAVAGFTGFAEWRAPGVPPPKDRDFALGLGPVVVTPDEIVVEGLQATVHVNREERVQPRFEDFDWASARDLAERGTVLRPGDLLAGPATSVVDAVEPGSSVELEFADLGTLSAWVRPRP